MLPDGVPYATNPLIRAATATLESLRGQPLGAPTVELAIENVNAGPVGWQ